MEAAGSHIDARVGGRGEELQESGRFSGFLRPTPPPPARAWKGAPTLENFGRKGKNSHQRSLLDFFALAEKSFQLSPVCS